MRNGTQATGSTITLHSVRGDRQIVWRKAGVEPTDREAIEKLREAVELYMRGADINYRDLVAEHATGWRLELKGGTL